MIKKILFLISAVLVWEGCKHAITSEILTAEKPKHEKKTYSCKYDAGFEKFILHVQSNQTDELIEKDYRILIEDKEYDLQHVGIPFVTIDENQNVKMEFSKEKMKFAFDLSKGILKTIPPGELKCTLQGK